MGHFVKQPPGIVNGKVLTLQGDSCFTGEGGGHYHVASRNEKGILAHPEYPNSIPFSGADASILLMINTSTPQQNGPVGVVSWHITPLDEETLPAVLGLEQESQPNPWGEETFRGVFETPFTHLDLLWCDGELAGYLCWQLVAGELEIHNVVTAPDWRRRQVAATLLFDVLRQGEAEGMERAFLEVRRGNVSAIALYRRFGFVEVGSRSCYYGDGEDALLFEWCAINQ
ncbi:MAG: hypothetical protein C0621_05145 [Desulfuromonas sp.]|nr:MAG: hypothetical protein C0621_05145 [Desulfuromonas sp.]